VILVAAVLALAVEVAAFVVVADRVGVLVALVILFGLSALGPFIVKRVGVGVLAHTRERLERGELPTRELLDGIVVLVGGVLITVPGFVGDALGLALMVGPVRHAVIRLGGHRLAHHVRRFPAGGGSVIDARSWKPDGAAGEPTPPMLPGERTGDPRRWPGGNPGS
jgi:UPF0716 protein FxsA